jgi:hypothetical protein
MKKQMLDKLRSNPHYIFSEKQKSDIDDDSSGMIEFGVLPVHNQNFKTHPTGQESLARSSRKTTKKKKL